MKHLKDCRCYPVEDLHFGYLCLEHAMELSEETVDTPHIVSLVEYYTKHVQAATPREGPAADIEASPAPVEKLTIVDEMKKLRKGVLGVPLAVQSTSARSERMGVLGVPLAVQST